MKTNATSLPVAAVLAPTKSVSLVEDVTTVPSVADLDFMASSGYQIIPQRKSKRKEKKWRNLTEMRYGKLTVLYRPVKPRL
jgi:hypothetical protein